MKKPELVAPAGTEEAFWAAVEAGADAVYLGLKEWSARGRARNFGLDDLARLVPAAHAQGRRVYVTLNTLVDPLDMPRVAAAVWELACLGVDALVLQDLGLARVCREIFPEVRLHASTQMSVHNAAGVRTLEALGFARVVLGRECTIPEIGAIRRETRASLEVFVHGALCYSVSGQCMASALLLGRSANRGWCGQPCRWGYRRPAGESSPEGPDADRTGPRRRPRGNAGPATGDRRPAIGREHHPLSTSDLCLVGRVWDLARARADALKIEGRLKAAEYVHTVVRAYRKVLDAPEADREAAVGAARELLATVASRPASEGYAVHPRPREVLRRGGAPALGARVGRVVRWKKGNLVLFAETELRRGDRIRIPTGATGQAVDLTLRKFRKRKVPGGFRYELECPQAVERGDRVLRTRTAAGEELEQRLVREARTHRSPAGAALDLAVSFGPGELRVRAACGPARTEAAYPVEFFEAERHPLDYHTLRTRFGRLGGTGYHLASFRVEGEIPPVVVPPSRLNEIRRDIVARMDRARAAEGEVRVGRLAPPAGRRPAGAPDRPRLWVRAETVRALRAGLTEGPHRIVALMTTETLRARERLAREAGGMDRVVWELPVWIAQADLPLYRERLEGLAAEGFREVCVTNPAHFALAEGLGFVLHAGRETNATNPWAAAALADLGCRSFVVSPEADPEAVARMGAEGWPARPVGYAWGRIPLFVTRLDPGVVWPPDEARVAQDGTELVWSVVPRALVREPAARVYRQVPFSWLDRVPMWRRTGIQDLLVDLQGPTHPGELASVLRELRRAWAGG
ncbi:peptidase U32 family protein [Deferrisoma camini]|uniref:peptidase U32 family protein n=1 Tax=Deferrisoma camini TaxID=1035120 RepID=UPI0004B06BF3|nr:U32 family peptidase [Deferrisoma camini]